MKTALQLKKEEDTRARLRRSARGRLALVSKKLGTSDSHIRWKPVKQFTQSKWVDTMVDWFSRPDLWNILGRIGGAHRCHYPALSKRDIAKQIVAHVMMTQGLTGTGLNAACSLRSDLRSVGCFCWVLSPACA